MESLVIRVNTTEMKELGDFPQGWFSVSGGLEIHMLEVRASKEISRCSTSHQQLAMNRSREVSNWIWCFGNARMSRQSGVKTGCRGRGRTFGAMLRRDFNVGAKLKPRINEEKI